MSGTDGTRAELAALRMLVERSLRREWEDEHHDPQWLPTIQVKVASEIDKQYRSDSLRLEIRQKMIEITEASLSWPLP